nr:MAG TPA: hypothetical protein [Caudoviricetes sp.]
MSGFLLKTGHILPKSDDDYGRLCAVFSKNPTMIFRHILC